jgi:tRNA splicing ligase
MRQSLRTLTKSNFTTGINLHNIKLHWSSIVCFAVWHSVVSVLSQPTCCHPWIHLTIYISNSAVECKVTCSIMWFAGDVPTYVTKNCK